MLSKQLEGIIKLKDTDTVLYVRWWKVIVPMEFADVARQIFQQGVYEPPE